MDIKKDSNEYLLMETIKRFEDENGRKPVVAISGITGMIGSTLAKIFDRFDVKVIGFARADSTKLSNVYGNESDNQHSDIEILEFSLNEYSQKAIEYVRAHLIKADVFYHFAWMSAFGDGRNNTSTQCANIEYTLAAVRLANEMGCKMFVGAGSQAEYGRATGLLTPTTPQKPENGYGIAKLAAGQLSRILCKQLSIKHVWGRILSVYGPGDNMYTMVMSAINDMLDGKVKAFTPGEQLWDFMYSEDCSMAFALLGLLGHDGQVYCLGSGKEKPLKDYIRVIRDKIDPSLALGLGMIEYSSNQVMKLCADISQLVEDTGFQPQTSFETGLEKTINWAKLK